MLKLLTSDKALHFLYLLPSFNFWPTAWIVFAIGKEAYGTG